jgi:hypothetical protein
MFQAMLLSVNSFRQIGGLDETIVAYQEWDTAIRRDRCLPQEGFPVEPYPVDWRTHRAEDTSKMTDRARLRTTG